MQTVYHAYFFDVSETDQKDAWLALKAKLIARGSRCFEAHGGDSYYQPKLDGAVLALDPAHLFDNQWNATPAGSDKGLRVFDWAKDYKSEAGTSRNIKRGHYLDLTDDMQRIRRETLKCGYCGHMQPASSGLDFCPDCYGSEYLKASDLKLTRLRPIDQSGPGNGFPDLTEDELAALLPRYREAQIHGANERDRARITRERKRIVEKYRKTVDAAQDEHDGMLWLMDHGIRTSNVIYYSHTGRFCFGWRRPYDHETTSALLDVISEFRWPYEIKSESRGTLSGNIG